MEKSFSGGGETERDAVSHIERRVWRSGGRSVETERDGVSHGMWGETTAHGRRAGVLRAVSCRL